MGISSSFLNLCKFTVTDIGVLQKIESFLPCGSASHVSHLLGPALVFLISCNQCLLEQLFMNPANVKYGQFHVKFNLRGVKTWKPLLHGNSRRA